MRRLTGWGTAAALALLGCHAAVAAETGVVPVQYDGPAMGGPMMGGPGYDMPPDFGPGMERGPFMGPGPYGPGRNFRGVGRHRRRADRGPIGPFASYHGFRIDLGEAQGRIDVRSALGEVEHQIDIVDRSGVSPAMLARFRAVPIRISVSFSGGGSHYTGGSEVTLGALQPNDDRPVLLHEYMHVLEYRTFSGGFHNATVGRFYEEARERGLYPQGAYMMSNPAEFFAVTASCYLHGTVARDPYTRAAIRERQPDYYAYLSRLFGPRLDASRAVPARGAVALAAGRRSPQPVGAPLPSSSAATSSGASLTGTIRAESLSTAVVSRTEPPVLLGAITTT